RALLLADPAAYAWAATVAAPLRAAPGGERVPELPVGTETPAPRVNGRAPADEPAAADEAAAAREAPAAADEAAAAREAPATADEAAAAREDAVAPSAPARSSKLGGALLIGAAAVIVAAVLIFVFTRGDDPEPATDAPAPTATATATAEASANDIVLRGPAGSQAVGLMRLFQANDGTVRFAIAAQAVEPNRTGETYSIWFRKHDGGTRLLGDVKDPVTKNGELTSAGPGNADVEAFPQWFATYDTVLVTLDDRNAKAPGKVILSGDLPHGRSG
ncbi:MAG TPA: hypothetical protein VNS09_10820, partial [Solirubrobacter sp.]|nr:hypothetical protein [Solirubrobacter sp.]